MVWWGCTKGMVYDVSGPIKISLHLGAHKTASTHLQKTIVENLEILTQNDIRFFGPSDLRGEKKRLQTRLGFGKKSGTLPAGVSGSDRLREMADGAGRVIISEENLLGPTFKPKSKRPTSFYHDADLIVEDFTRAAQDAQFSLFLAVRNPADFLVSLYSQYLLSHAPLSYAAFCETASWHHVNWPNLIQRLRGVPGVKHVYVWQYEEYPRVLVPVMRRMLRWKLGKLVEPIETRLHQGLSGAAVSHALAHPEDRSQAGKNARELFPIGDANPRFDPLSPGERAQSAQKYADDLAAIEALENVTVLRSWKPRPAS